MRSKYEVLLENKQQYVLMRNKDRKGWCKNVGRLSQNIKLSVIFFLTLRIWSFAMSISSVIKQEAVFIEVKEENKHETKIVN